MMAEPLGGAAPVRFLMADDSPVLLQGLSALLDQQPGFEQVGAVSSGEEALEALARCEVDLVLLDVVMPGIGGLAAARHIRQEHPAVTVVMLTAFESTEGLATALEVGAAGYLTKDMDVDAIVAALRAAMLGGRVIGPAVSLDYLRGERGGKEAAGEDQAFRETVERELAPRLMRVFRGLALGLSNRQIAERTGLSVDTVRTYASQVLGLLGCRSRAEVARRAARAGLGEEDGGEEGRIRMRG